MDTLTFRLHTSACRECLVLKVPVELDLCSIPLLLLVLQLLGPSAQQTFQLFNAHQPAESNAIHLI